MKKAPKKESGQNKGVLSKLNDNPAKEEKQGTSDKKKKDTANKKDHPAKKK